VKRAPKAKKKAKIPDRFIPIVDAVVEGVFARLSEAAVLAKQAKSKRGPARGTGEAEPESDRGLAGAIADHLLASLTREASKPKKPKKPKRAKRRRRAG